MPAVAKSAVKVNTSCSFFTWAAVTWRVHKLVDSLDFTPRCDFTLDWHCSILAGIPVPHAWGIPRDCKELWDMQQPLLPSWVHAAYYSKVLITRGCLIKHGWKIRSERVKRQHHSWFSKDLLIDKAKCVSPQPVANVEIVLYWINTLQSTSACARDVVSSFIIHGSTLPLLIHAEVNSTPGYSALIVSECTAEYLSQNSL